MITLSLLKYLENNGFGTIDQDLFFEKLGLDKRGVFITSEGGTQASLANRKEQSFTLYSRGTSDVAGYQKLERIVDFLNASYGECELPSVQDARGNTITEGYRNVAILPCSSISNVGVDEGGRVIYSARGRIIY